MRHIPAIYLRVEAQKRHFRRYMAKIRAIFRSKSAHGTNFPWDGSADPWDGNRNPWDGSTKGPLPAAFSTLKGGRTRASALTVCHIAHTAVGHFRRRLRGHPIARAVALGGAAFLPPENARGTAPNRHSFPRCGPCGCVCTRKAAPPMGCVCCRGALCAICQTVNADGLVCPPFSVGNAAGWGVPVDPSLRFLFPSHGSADPSHGNFVPWDVFGGKFPPICAI